jgi:dephospho-CoA kinase
MERTPNRSVLVVTGSIASGKSLACQFLSDFGAFIVSADQVARDIVKPGSPALLEIANEFGAGFIAPDGTLKRKELGALVFSEPQKRQKLEAITHPRIRVEADRRLAEGVIHGKPLVVYDCPLYFEAGLDKLGFGAVVLIYLEDNLALERAAQRDGENAEAVKKRLAAQMPIEEKANRSDIVVHNDGSKDDLRQKMKEIFDRYRNRN